MQQFAITFLSILLEALPFVLLGTIISSLIEIFVSQEWLTNHLPKKSIFAYLVAGIVGIIFPICECAIVPIMRRLVKKGMPVGVAITFMLATPTINPIVLLSTHYAFPNNIYFPILRGALGYLTAISVGFIMAFLSDKSDIKTENHKQSIACGCGHDHNHDHEEHHHMSKHKPDCVEINLCNEEHHDHEISCNCGHDYEEDSCSCGHTHVNKKTGIGGVFQSILAHTSSELYEVGRFLIMGALISSALQTFLPREYFFALAKNPALAMIMMMLFAFVLSLCSEADAFVAASFRGYLPNSSLMAFLVFGPMMDIKNTMMLASGFKARFIIRLIIVIGVVTFIFSSLSAFMF